ncbi:unnamed protein product [Acanthoscelides obtectus]|uniref:HTH psq-type domain-containing protein n=1 Tax=Acanthoscelides obtectus TaxID=200917 RepID=A0A9P0PAL1_ACAOB|nr:unnamed protein product [Acanthoscelides obtectus]CAK1631372.1 hypothetical protein AOBTE_LOCUS6912 [Acanthoscelides obtectus]
MPTTYKRKNEERAKWSAGSLKNAIECVQNRTLGVNEAARQFGIPKTTLKDRIKKGDAIKQHRLGPSSALGEDAEPKLHATHTKIANIWICTRSGVRLIWDFQLAEKLKLKHTFNKEGGKAGYDWLNSFLRRHPDISIRKAEGISVNRVTGMNCLSVKHYFTLLENVLTVPTCSQN